MLTKYRNPVFDTMKGIGILLVILGHQDGAPIAMKQMIYAFHMPLFFIIAGYFFSNKDIKKQIISDVNRLIIPYFITSVFFLIAPLIYIFLGRGYTPLFKALNRIIQGNLGPLWFLLALFWCKIVFNAIVSKIKNKFIIGGISCGISYIVVILFGKVSYNPFAVCQGLSALVFFYIGFALHGGGRFLKLCIMILSIITYIVACLYFPILDMCTLNYSIWGINVLAGLGGTLLLYTIVSKYMKRNNIFTKLGMVTLPILCFHTLEFQTLIGSFWPLFADLSWVLQFIIRVVFSLIMVAVCKHIEFTRRLFRI